MKNPAHPGRLVASAIDAEGWTVTHAAERLGVTRAFLSRILHGHAAVTAATALRLEALGWSDAETGCGCRRATTSPGNAGAPSPEPHPARATASAAHDRRPRPAPVLPRHSQRRPAQPRTKRTVP